MERLAENILERLFCAIIGAVFGFIVWIVLIFIVRWVIIFAGLIFGFEWIPSFFGWGTAVVSGVCALIAVLIAD